jgi:uncharacterized delta-60 repeat protein
MNVLRAVTLIVGASMLLLLTNRARGQAGEVDPTFNPGTGADSFILSTLLQPDGKILIGGAFRSFNGITRSNLARLNLDGSVDLTFDPGPGPGNPPENIENYGVVRSLALDATGRILAVGNFPTARFYSSGSRDTNFAPPGMWADAVGTDPSGRIIIAGDWTIVSGLYYRARIVRLFEDGTLDLSFDAGHRYAFDHGIYTLTLRADGNIVIGGGFDFIADQERPGIAELDSTGTLVPNAFTEGFDHEVDALALQPDGKVLSGGGDYTRFHGWVTRYTADGAVDPEFNPPFTDQFVLALAVQNDGKILVGGSFTMVNGLDRPYIVRLLPDGSVDPSFNVGTGPDGIVSDIKIQPDGRIIVVGAFATFNGVPRSGIVRLLDDTPVLGTQRGPRDTIINSWSAAYTDWVLQATRNLKSDNWETVTTPPTVVNGINYVTNRIGDGRFYRLVQQ